MELTYDDAGYLIRNATDSGADGDFDVVAEHVVDAGTGHRLLTEIRYTDTPAMNSAWAYTYGPDGLLVLDIDYGMDGAVNETWTYTYTPTGQLSVFAIDGGANGTVDYREESAYDVDGRLASTLFDEYGNGKVLMLDTYTYAEDGTLEFEDVDYGADGSVDTYVSYSWDFYADCPRLTLLSTPGGIMEQYIKDLANYGTFRANLDADVKATGNIKNQEDLNAAGMVMVNDLHFGNKNTTL